MLIDRHDTIQRQVIPYAIRVPIIYMDSMAELIGQVQAARLGFLIALAHNGDPKWMDVLHAYGVWLRYSNRAMLAVFDEVKVALGPWFSFPLRVQDAPLYNFDHIRLPTLEEFTVKHGWKLHATKPADMTDETIAKFCNRSIPEPGLRGVGYPSPIPGCRHWITTMYLDVVPKLAPDDTLDSNGSGLGGSQWKKEGTVPSIWPPAYPGFYFGEDPDKFKKRCPLLPGDSSMDMYYMLKKDTTEKTVQDFWCAPRGGGYIQA
jgi:hypothetical protein